MMSTSSDNVSTSLRKIFTLKTLAVVLIGAAVGFVITYFVIRGQDRKFTDWVAGECVDGKQVSTRSAKGFSGKSVTIFDLQKSEDCKRTRLSNFSYKECKSGLKEGIRTVVESGVGIYSNDPLLNIVERCQDSEHFSNRTVATTAAFYAALNFEGATTTVESDATYVLVDELSKIQAQSCKVPKGTTFKVYRKVAPVTLPTQDGIGGDLNLTWVPENTSSSPTVPAHWVQAVDEDLWKPSVDDEHLVFEHTLTENVPDLLRYLISIPEFQDLEYPNPMLDKEDGSEIKQVDTTAGDALDYAIKLTSNGSDHYAVNDVLVQPLVVRVVIPDAKYDFSESEPRVEMKTFGYTSDHPTFKDITTFDPLTIDNSQTWAELESEHLVSSMVPSAFLVPSASHKVLVIKNGKVAASYGTFIRKTTITGHWIDHRTLRWDHVDFEQAPKDGSYNVDFATRLLAEIAEQKPDVDLDHIDVVCTFKVKPITA